MNDPLEKLLSSKKYQSVCPDTVRRVWAECAQRHKKPKDAERAAREALHGITGAFLTPDESARCLRDMRAWAEGGRSDELLARALERHASTRERLPISRVDALCARVASEIGRPERVLDLACGLNPLYLGARGIHARGVDISGEAVRAINACAADYGLPVSAACADLLCEGAIPAEYFDLALLLKTLPLIERQRRGAARDVMARVNARFLIASFPTRTLGGRNVGMEAHYSAWMAENLPANRRVAARFADENELFYLLAEA